MASSSTTMPSAIETPTGRNDSGSSSWTKTTLSKTIKVILSNLNFNHKLVFNFPFVCFIPFHLYSLE